MVYPLIEDYIYHNKAWPPRKESFALPFCCNPALVLTKWEKWFLEMTSEPDQGIGHLLELCVSSLFLQREKAGA